MGWWQGVGVFCGVWGSCCVCCVLAGAGGVVAWVRVGLTGREAEGPWHEPEKGD